MGVRLLVALRPDVRPAQVNVLAGDPDAKVLKAVAPNPLRGEDRLRARVARHGSRVAVRVAHNPRCGPALLHELANLVPPVQRVYRTVAAHPRAMAPTLLLGPRDTPARPVAARHPALPVATIMELLDDAHERVAESAAANASLPRPVMERLLRTGP